MYSPFFRRIICPLLTNRRALSVICWWSGKKDFSTSIPKWIQLIVLNEFCIQKRVFWQKNEISSFIYSIFRCKGTIFFLHTQQNSAEIAFFCHFPQSFDIVVYHQIVKLRLKKQGTICELILNTSLPYGQKKSFEPYGEIRNLNKSFYHSRTTLLRGSPKFIATALHFGEHPKTQPLNLK